MLKTVTIGQKDRWLENLGKCSTFDCYHTYEYHKISYENGEGEPILFVYEKDNQIICFPLLKREIRDKLDRLYGYDFTSVYGYGGPIYSKKITKKLIWAFANEFKNYCEKNEIISVFSRLHPLILQNFILENFGEVQKSNNTIFIDLTQDLTKQRKHYRKSNKNEINKLRNISSILWSDNFVRDLPEFIDIYEETMLRVNANKKYFFPKNYYKDLLSSKEFETRLIFVEHNGKKIAGALFIFCNDIIQYHLAGTKTDFMKLTPMKLIIDEVRILGTHRGFKSLHLGGGTTNFEDDPLFKFKRGFSKNECEFSIFKWIVDQNKYNKIVEILTPSRNKTEVKIFPLYR